MMPQHGKPSSDEMALYTNTVTDVKHSLVVVLWHHESGYQAGAMQVDLTVACQGCV